MVFPLIAWGAIPVIGAIATALWNAGVAVLSKFVPQSQISTWDVIILYAAGINLTTSLLDSLLTGNFNAMLLAAPIFYLSYLMAKTFFTQGFLHTLLQAISLSAFTMPFRALMTTLHAESALTFWGVYSLDLLMIIPILMIVMAGMPFIMSWYNFWLK